MATVDKVFLLEVRDGLFQFDIFLEIRECNKYGKDLLPAGKIIARENLSVYNAPPLEDTRTNFLTQQSVHG